MRSKLRFPVTVLWLAVQIGPFSSISFGSSSIDATSIDQGALLYRNFCAACHGQDARGDGPAASELKIRPPSLRLIAERHNGKFDAAAVHARIDGRDMPRSHGTIEMPIWGNLFRYVAEVSDVLVSDSAAVEKDAQDRIRILVEYLESIQDAE
jgi:mono/diheme cytochrome c family protein